MPFANESSVRYLVMRLTRLSFLRITSTIAPLVTLPVVARHATNADWAAIGVGTSIGTIGAVAVNLGWALSGPPRVAGQTAQTAAEVLSDSRRSSLLALALCAPLAALAGALIGPSSARGLAAAVAVAIAMSGLSVGWYIAARDGTRALAFYDVLPRVVGACVSAIIIGVLGPRALWTFPLALGLAAATGPFLYCRRHTATSPPRLPRRVLITHQSTPAITGILGNLYSGLSLALIATVTTTTEMASASSAFRLYLVALSAIVVVHQATLHWAVGGAGAADRQLRLAGTLHCAVGGAGLIFFATVGPAAGQILFSTDHAFNGTTSVAMGVAFAALAAHTFVNTHLLLPFGFTRVGLQGTVFGVALGMPSTLALAHQWGASGGAFGVALAETAVASYLVSCAFRLRGRRVKVAAKGV